MYMLLLRRSLLGLYARGSVVSIPRSFLYQMSTTASTSNAPMSITVTPAAGQHILHEGKEYTTIKEGLAYILIPATSPEVPQTNPKADNSPQSVFYNPIQQFNRDLSVLAIKAFGEELLEKKRAEIERARKSRDAKKDAKKEKKRKREEDGEQVESRKVGKLEHNSDVDVQVEIDAQLVVSADANMSGLETVQNDATSGLKPESETEAKTEGERTEKQDGSGEKYKLHNGTRPETGKLQEPSFTILDALSATGLRAVRYAHEIPFTTSVTANDLLPEAATTIKLNAKHNKVEEKIAAVTGNALAHMYSLVCDPVDSKGRPKPTKKYDVIDLDPYGTAAPFLDAAVQAVRDGGLLCVTCTDAGVWASNGYPEKCYSLYGGIPIKGLHSHEGGLRLILHAIATSAARYGLSIEPLLSLSIDFYARVFVRVRKSAANVKFLAGTTMNVYNCDQGCGAFYPQLIARNKLSPNKSGNGTFYKHVFAQAPTSPEKCKECGMKTHLAGPMYAGPLHNVSFVERILQGLPSVSKETYATTERIEGMLTTALNETLPPLDTEGDLKPPSRDSSTHDPAAVDQFPFFFIPSVLAKVIHCVTPHENALKGALRHLGYRVTRSHTKAGSIKTDAPWSVIWEVMREWVRQKAPIKEGANKEGSFGWKIMQGSHLKEDAKPKGEEKEESEKGDGEGPEVQKSELKVIFDEKLGMEKDKKKLVRYQINPRENWGPMNRAKGH